MTDKKITPAKKADKKSSLHDEIYKKISTALISYKGALGEKKFEKKLKKASKLFIESIEKAGKKLKPTKITPAKKITKKPVKKVLAKKAPAKK
jgi:hypothetical protein